MSTSTSSQGKESIVIIGAGVVGLSVATRLQKHYPSARRSITIIASELPTTSSPSVDYASLWAGAHYRPIPSSLDDEANTGFRTAEVMKQIAKESPEAGVATMKGVEYLENPPKENLALRSGDVYAGEDDEFRVLNDAELPKGVKWGCEYNAYCVNVPVYLKWLFDNFQSKGGQVIQRKLESPEDAFTVAQEAGLKNVKVVVNCSGRNFDRDPRMKIIRGQTVLVKKPFNKTITRQDKDGSWATVIPRPGGGTIVGVSKEIDDLEDKPRAETRQRLLEKSVEYFPEFVSSVDEFEVVKDNVGRRPWREGGLRIEAEELANSRTIVHGYGAGGRGYELSWGAADRIVELVAARLTPTSKL